MRCCWTNPRTISILSRSTGCRTSCWRYRGTLITISHDRHFLNAVCTHIADIDYQTIITYNGGYDDMVMQKVSVRTRIESQNEERTKKIEQLNDFIARFSAGTRSSQVNSRKKEVERLATTELARSNIQRPFIRFDTLRPSGKHVLEVEGLTKTYETPAPDGTHGPVFAPFTSQLMRGDKVMLIGRNGTGKTTLIKSLLSGVSRCAGQRFRTHAGRSEVGPRGADRLLRAGPQGCHPDGHNGGGMAARL